MFDGWTEGIEHYIGVSVLYNAICTETGMQIPTQCLLSMKRLLANEIEGMTAADHLTLLSRVLNINGRITEDVLCIVGDNCSVTGGWLAISMCHFLAMGATNSIWQSVLGSSSSHISYQLLAR